MNDVIKSIFRLLDDWRTFPNYQLERRLDIFFAYFLPEILASTEGFSDALNKRDFYINLEETEKYKHIIPEFPFLVGFGMKERESDKSYKVLNSNIIHDKVMYKKEYYYKNVTRHSAKVDYAVFDMSNNKVCFVELKTTNESINNEQVKLHKTWSKRKWPELIADILFIREEGHDKYDKLLKRLDYILKTNSNELETACKEIEQDDDIENPWNKRLKLSGSKLVAWHKKIKTFSDSVVKNCDYKWVYIIPYKDDEKIVKYLSNHNLSNLVTLIGFDDVIEVVKK